MKTSIVILTYNKLEYTKLCIESIRNFTDPESYEIIVVDNHSTDGTVEWLKEQIDIMTIFNQENVGFPKGCNQGIEISTGENILLLNNDVVVTYHWLENLTTALYHSDDVGAVGPVTNSASYYSAIPVDYKSIDEMQKFAYRYNTSNQDQWEERLKLIGFCLLIKKSVVDQIGLLDERFTPGNFEDDDYSYRIKLAGFKLVICKDTFVHHYGSLSWKDKPESYRELLSVNEKKFENKWGFNPGYSSFIRDEIINLISEPVEKQMNVLEIGCACGGSLLKIKSIYKNAELYGIELNDHSAKIAKTFAEVISDNIEKGDLSFPKHHFDYIILADVLEHLYDPWNVLKEMRNYLKDTGKILISIPNVMHFSLLRQVINGNWTYADSGILDRTHVRFFTLSELNKMLVDAGYKDMEYGKTQIGKTVEDEDFIKKLTLLSNRNMEGQYDAYQYIVKANKNDEVEYLFSKWVKSENPESEMTKNLSLLESLDLEKVLDIFEKIKVDKRKTVKILNNLAKINIEANHLKNVIPFLEQAYTFDNKNRDTIFYIVFMLNKFDETALALSYFESLDGLDPELQQLKDEIVMKNNNKNRKKFIELLKRYEMDRQDDQVIQMITELLENKELNIKIIIETVHSVSQQPKDIFNFLATVCYQIHFKPFIQPLLIESYNLDQSDSDTLFNLGLYYFDNQEHETALYYLGEIDHKDTSINELINTIKSAVK